MTASFSCFITGTDTEIGKTLVSSIMLRQLARNGVKAIGMKPVAAGSVMRDGSWHNDDVDALVAETHQSLPASLTTPYMLREPAAPHIVAALENVEIDIPHILDCYRQVADQAEAVVVEGVGGFRVPLNKEHDTADLAQQLDLPVIMVVGLRLGCLNHALLTADAIAARGLKLAGWVANAVDPDMAYTKENFEALVARLPVPPLGAIPWLSVASAVTAEIYLDFTSLPGWPGTSPKAP
jgi:dethiobiotin synthetase